MQRAWYEVIAAPPFDGAWKRTVTLAFPGATEGVDGWDGLVMITIAGDGTENGPAPLAFVA